MLQSLAAIAVLVPSYNEGLAFFRDRLLQQLDLAADAQNLRPAPRNPC